VIDYKQMIANSYEGGTIVEEHLLEAKGGKKILKYKKGRFLGKGKFAKCYELTNMETKKTYAAKIITKTALSKFRAKEKVIFI